LDQQTKLTLALAKRFFGALTVLDVGVDAVPFDDLTVVITQRAGTEQKPSIFTVVPTQARFRLTWCVRSQDPLPSCCEAVQIFRVHGSRPTPTGCLFCRETGEVLIVLVEELGASIGECRPRQRRNRID